MVICDLESGRTLKRFAQGKPGDIDLVAVSGDGKRLATWQYGTVKVWEISTGREGLTFKTGPDDPTMGRLYSNSFFSLSADGKLLAFGGWPKQPEKGCWKGGADPRGCRNRLGCREERAGGASCRGLSGSLYPLLSQDGKTLATWSIQYGYWRPPSRKPGDLEPAPPPRPSPDPTKVLRLWDVATGKLISQARMSSSNPSSVVFSPDGQTIAASTWDGLIERWDTHTGEPKPHLHGRDDRGQRLAFSRDGKTGRSWYRWCRPEVGHDRRSIAR